MNKYFSFLVTFLLFASQSISQSYEGYLHPNQFVWMDLTISKEQAVSVSYFNKLQGGEIKFTGTQSGDTLQLSESGSNPGSFRMIMYRDSIVGTWKRAGTKSGAPIRLYITNPAFKSYSSIPNADVLITRTGSTLATEMKSNYPQGAVINPFEVTFAEKGLLTTRYAFTKKEGELVIDHTRYQVFNLKTNKQIDLLQELEPTKVEMLMVMLNDRALSVIREHISNSGLSEEEWIQELGGAEKFKLAMEKPNLNKEILSAFRLERDGLYVMKDNYFGLSSALTSLDLDMAVRLSYTEIQPFLRKGSVLSF